MPQIDPFGFLNQNPARERRFAVAVDGYNKWHQVMLKDSRHIYEHVSNRGRASETREWAVGHIMEAFLDDEGVKRRNEGGVDGMMIDNTWFLHYKMISTPELLPPEPRTIALARQRAQQIPLEWNESNMLSKEIPFHNLYFILVGYVRSGGAITDLYFIDQSGEDPRYQLLRPLTSIRNHREFPKPKVPETVFVPKPI